jgi:hypothetical protein
LIIRSGNSVGESRFFYDAHGHRTRQERWENGELATYTDFQTDTDGRYLTWHTDVDADGQIDRIQMWTYEGDVAVEQSESVRDATTGEWFVTRHTQTVDDLGRVTGWEADIGDDNIIDHYSMTTWEGDTQTMMLDHDADGIWDFKKGARL